MPRTMLTTPVVPVANTKSLFYNCVLVRGISMITGNCSLEESVMEIENMAQLMDFNSISSLKEKNNGNTNNNS